MLHGDKTSVTSILSTKNQFLPVRTPSHKMSQGSVHSLEWFIFVTVGSAFKEVQQLYSSVYISALIFSLI